MENCIFCAHNRHILQGAVLSENKQCYFVESIDPILRYAGMIIPARHVCTPFELTKEEWVAIQDMLHEAKKILDEHNPQGYNIGWNVGETAGQNVSHAHLHVIARFDDEPLAGKGIRHAFKQESNKRRSAE